MKTLTFLIQGSKPDPYEVKCKIINDRPVITCTCDAAENGMHCKHRLNLLDGDISAIIEGDTGELTAFIAATKNSEIMKTRERIQAIELEKKNLEREIKSLKKHLGMALLGKA